MNLYDKLRVALEAGAPGPFRDGRVGREKQRSAQPAAVLVPITERPVPGVILTQRPEWLRRHAGQVAFPGGRADAQDSDLIATALREAQEEIGLSPDLVRIVGEASPYVSGSGFHITPVLGLIPPDAPLAPCPNEVESIFEVPFDFLFDRDNAELKTGEWRGEKHQYLDMYWQDRRIWGVTAGIVHNLSHQLGWPFELT